jgi:WD40 repeat protein
VVDAWFAPGGDNLRLFVNAGDAASVWSTNDAALVQTRWGAVTRGPAGLSGDGRRMVSLASGTLALWSLDPARDEPPRVARPDDGTSFATLTPDGAQVVLVDEQGRVRLRPWGDDQTAPPVADFGDALSAAAPSPDGNRIVGGFRAGFVRFANRNPSRPGGYGEPHSLGRHARQVNDIAFRPGNPRVFVTASRDGAACLWALPPPGSPDAVEAPDGGCAARVARHSASVNTAAFSPDGALLVTASDDSTAGVWDVVHLRLVRYLRGHTDQVNSAAFSADGGRIVTASRDGTFRVWETATGRCLATLQGRMGPLVRAAFAAWGARSLLVTVSAAGTVRLWTLDGAQVERAARSFLGDAGSAPARDAGP